MLRGAAGCHQFSVRCCGTPDSLTNIVLAGARVIGLFEESDEPGANRRFKAIVLTDGEERSVGVGDVYGRPIPSHGLDEYQTLTTDSTDQIINWPQGLNLRVRLSFRLRQASLFSFWFDDSV